MLNVFKKKVVQLQYKITLYDNMTVAFKNLFNTVRLNERAKCRRVGFLLLDNPHFALYLSQLLSSSELSLCSAHSAKKTREQWSSVSVPSMVAPQRSLT